MIEILHKNIKQDNILEDIKLFVNNINILNHIFDEDINKIENKIDIAETKLNKILIDKTKLNNEIELINKDILKEKLKQDILNNIFKILNTVKYFSPKKKNELIELVNKIDSLDIDKLKQQNNHFLNLLNGI